MAKFNIKWSERKSGNYGDYIVADLVDEAGQELEGVSINEKSKKGDVFPNFKELMTGQDVEGELWTSDAGKHYLFPPRKKLDKPNFMKAKEAMIEKAVERKEKSISGFQDSKDWSIKTSSTMRDAVLIAIEESKVFPAYDFQKGVLKWRKWLWDNFDVNLKDTDALDGTL